MDLAGTRLVEADADSLDLSQRPFRITADGQTILANAVILATGRRPFLAGLDLEAAGVAIEGHRIPVNPDQVTNVPHIYAVGDVTDRINLTPVAVDEGRAFADTVYGNKPRRVNLTTTSTRAQRVRWKRARPFAAR